MRIIYKTSIGLSVVYPTGELSIDEVAAKDVPAGVSFHIVEDSEIPSDVTFRNAWELSPENTIQINFTAAQHITKDRLRLERGPLMAAQDVLFMRAQEAGENTGAIVNEKRRLRDITKLADTCTTLDQLSALKC